MSSSSAFGGIRMQYNSLSWIMILVFLTTIAFVAVSCGDSPNRANETSIALSSLTDTSSDEDIRNAVEDEVGNDDDARRIANAIIQAHERGASFTEIANKLDEMSSKNATDVVREINQIREDQATAIDSATPTPTASGTTVAAPLLTEAQVRTIAEDAARKAATEAGGNLLYSEVQTMIDTAVANAIVQYKQNPSLTEAQVRAIINDAVKTLNGVTTLPTPSAKDDEFKAEGKLPSLPNDISHDGWEIKLAESAVDRGDKNGDGWPDDDGMVGQWLGKLNSPAPELWQTAPNVPNSQVPAFDVKAGLEYTGDWNTPFCQQDMRCDFVVPAGSFRYVGADYGFLDIDNCAGEEGVGFELWLVNVSDNQSHIWRNQCADNGGTRHGRFFDGGRLDQGIWGGVSHESAGMLNMPTIFNATNGEVGNAGGDTDSNAGANCGGRVTTCEFVDITIVVHAGDRILATAHTRISRP